MEADGEWSDGSDDALRSGSATDIGPSDGEELNNDEKKMATTNRLLKSDPVNAILDKIDAELGAMNSSPVTMQSKCSPKSVSKEKSKSEDSKQNTKSKPVPLNNGNTLQGVNKKDMKAKDGDHCPSDLDSVAAEQIDEKFKEIMKKKRGGYLEDLNKQQSDNETIKTEDFENNFKSSLIHNKACQCGCSRKLVKTKKLVSFSDQLIMNGKPPSGKKKVAEDLNQTKSPCKIQQKTTIPQALPPRNIYYASDMESVKTEDFESKFSDLLIRDNTMIKSSVPPARSQTSALSTAASGSKPSLQQPTLNRPETSDGQITDKKSSDRKIQFLENGHVHLPSDPVLKKKESSPRRMLSDYGRTTPSSDACSNSTLANGHVPYSSVNGHAPHFNEHIPNSSVNVHTHHFSGHIPNSSANVRKPNFIDNGQSPATNPLKGNSSHGAMANQVSTSPTNNGVLSATNSTIPSFSRSLPVTSLRNSPPGSKPSYHKTLKRLSRQLSWDGSNVHPYTSDCLAIGDSSITNFEEVESLATCTSTKSASSVESLTSANAFQQYFFPSATNTFSGSRQSSVTSVSSGYIAELEDSVNDPISRSPSTTDFLLEGDKDDSKDTDSLENVFDRVLTWDNDPGSHSVSAQSSFNISEPDNKMKSVTSDSDLSSISTKQKDLILPEEDSTGISFSKHSINKTDRSDSSVQFSTESSAYSDTTDSLYTRQQSVSLPNIASASTGMSPMFHGVSPPISKFTSQENVNYGNFGMINPMMHHVPSTAESVLLSLGFGDTGRCLPQRFMKSWYEKLATAQAEQQECLMRQQLQKTHLSHVQNVHFQKAKASDMSQSSVTSKSTNESPASDQSRSPIVPKLSLKSKITGSVGRCTSNVKVTRLARLREYVESHAGLLKVGLGRVDHKRKIFSDSRQQSLPISLETLNEEEEVYPNRERIEVNKNSLLKEFLQEENNSDSLTSFSDSDLSLSSCDKKKHEQECELKEIFNKPHDVPKDEKVQEQTVNNFALPKARKMNSNCSSDSLEVANIMKPTQIEPAMVSIILQDVDGNIQMTSPIPVDQSDSTLLHIPVSRSSSSPISPIPQSPVTVIEVGLDNQLDSLDIDDTAQHLSSRLSEIHEQQGEVQPELNDFVDNVSEEAVDAECVSIQLSTSPEDSPSPLPSPLNISPTVYEDAFMRGQTDDGASPSVYEDSSSGIQADDGSLTPLEKINDCDLQFEVVHNLGDEFYLIKEGRVQCVDVGCQYEPQPSDRIKYPLFRNQLVTIGSSDSDSLISDSSQHLDVNTRPLISPPIHLLRSTNRNVIKGAKLALSDSELHKPSSEKRHMIFGSPALVLTNVNGEENDLDPDSDANYKSRFKPIDSSMESSIGSDDDHYLITKPRPRRCSRHKRSLIFSDKKISDCSNSDESVLVQTKPRKLFQCDSVEQECQTDKNYILDSSSSSSSSPSPHSRCDQEMQMDRESISSLVDQCTQTTPESSEPVKITVCKLVQTDSNRKCSQCVQTVGLLRTSEAFCQTLVPPLSQSIGTQTYDENMVVEENFAINECKEIPNRFTSTAKFTLKTQFNASPGTGAFLSHLNTFNTLSSSETSLLNLSETSSENGSLDSSCNGDGKYFYYQNSQYQSKDQKCQAENTSLQSFSDSHDSTTTCSSLGDHVDCLISKTPLRYSDNQPQRHDIETPHLRSSSVLSDIEFSDDDPSRTSQYNVIAEVADLPCSSRDHLNNGFAGITNFQFNKELSASSSQSESSEAQVENSEIQMDRISEMLCSVDEIDNGSVETQFRSYKNDIMGISETPSLSSSDSVPLERSCERIETDVNEFEMTCNSSEGCIDDTVSQKTLGNHVKRRLSKTSFKSARKQVDSGFYETLFSSSDDQLVKKVSEAPFNIRQDKCSTRVSECSSSNQNQNRGNLSNLPPYQDKSHTIEKRVSETPYRHTRVPIHNSDSDIPYGGHMYHIENEGSQSKYGHSKDNINVWVSETPYIIRPGQNSMLDQMKRSFSGNRRSYRRKSVKALAHLFDHNQ